MEPKTLNHLGFIIDILDNVNHNYMSLVRGRKPVYPEKTHSNLVPSSCMIFLVPAHVNELITKFCHSLYVHNLCFMFSLVYWIDLSIMPLSLSLTFDFWCYFTSVFLFNLVFLSSCILLLVQSLRLIQAIYSSMELQSIQIHAIQEDLGHCASLVPA